MWYINKYRDRVFPIRYVTLLYDANGKEWFFIFYNFVVVVVREYISSSIWYDIIYVPFLSWLRDNVQISMEFTTKDVRLFEEFFSKVQYIK